MGKKSKYITATFHQILGCYRVLSNLSELECVKRVGFLMPLPGFLFFENNAMNGTGRAGEHPALEDSYSLCSSQRLVSISTVSHESQLQTGMTSFQPLFSHLKKSKLVKTKTATMCAQGCERRNKDKQICSLAYPTSSSSQHDP